MIPIAEDGSRNPISSAEVTRLVDYFLRDETTAKFGPYEAIDTSLEIEELLPSWLYRLQMLDREDMRVDVQVFLGLGELGGLMWEQDIRALLRIAGTNHPAMPRVMDGGYLTEADTLAAGSDVGGMAFVVTRGARRTAGPDTIDEFRTDPRKAFRQFRSLVDGLAILHQLGLVHRNISPATIDVYPGPSLRLARFELSALVADLFRSTVDSEVDPRSLRALFLAEGGQSLAYAPKERLAFLLGDEQETDLIENERSDVYALAAVAWEWFVGPFSAEVLPPRVDGLPDATQAALIREAHGRFRAYLRVTAVVVKSN